MESQQRGNELLLQATKRTVKSIAEQVEKQNNRPVDVAILQDAQAIQHQSNLLISKLRKVRRAMHRSAQPISESTNRKAVAELVMRPATTVDSLYIGLQQFAAHCGEYLPSEQVVDFWHQLHLTPSAKTTAIQQYRETFFEGATVAEASTGLAQQETEVIQLGNKVLQALSQKVSCCFDGFLTIKAQAIPKARTVKPGDVYEAELMLLQGIHVRNPRMTANGRSIPVDDKGHGHVAFTVPDNLPPGKNSVNAFWDGTIRITTYGRDSTFRVRVPYTIHR
ncbi:hypothetical protein [Hymenobacter pini]|uniref:hypothetical protein n=1 Tax=Hymenobacter pini TaxID=2880879 RepID=UPI001CF18B35|nr:hypothetical protein [Hymenobacter pini]MCA8830006.1 hypothetical protein [Hymenobacter pini]